jgi:UDP-N-acetylmuramoyl-L-alanyl-D-glutamate--2,6-diaminopimelate ligase
MSSSQANDPQPNDPRWNAVGRSLIDVFKSCRFAQCPDLDTLDTASLTDIQWRADRCSPSSILCFQRFDDGKPDAEIVERYLAQSPFGALVINRALDPRWLNGPLAGRPLFVTAPGAWGETLEQLCDYFYPRGPRQWQIAGVTGTNGKTTTVKYLESILLAAGRRVLSVGTLGLALNGESLSETGFTSPPYIELRRILHQYRDQADTLVMEVSSHALHQGRVQGLRFAAAAWTNFSQDHLDYHRDEASYFAAKALILDQLADGVPLLTTSAEVAHRLRAERGDEPAITRIDIPALTTDLVQARPFLALSYNRANYALARALEMALLGAEPEAPWRCLKPVPGRFDCHVFQNRTIVIDFAHTPDALENILDAIREAFPGAGILTLFGCGGDRDRGKRPLMGAAVCRGSDQVILTSDNPRFEDPRAIVDDTLQGMSGCEAAPTVILDRAEAIAALFDHLAEYPMDQPWVALIAGKGHEPYIDQNGVKRPYSDREQVLGNLRRLGWAST